MATYVYRCKNCKHEFETQQGMSEDPLTLCPECGEEKLFRVMQPVGARFKGSGFHVNDYPTRSSRGI